MAGDIKNKYLATQTLTVTNLHSIATSATWVGGWTSGTIDHSSDLAVAGFLSGQFTVASSGLSAGLIIVSVYGAFTQVPGWPDLFSAGTEGTQGTATIHDTEIRDGAFIPLWTQATDTSASRIYTMPPRNVALAFGGEMPSHWAIFVAHSTGANLAASGNALYFTPLVKQYT
jgi:hypothetical protein